MKRVFQVIGVVAAIAVLAFGITCWMYFVNHNFRTVEKGAFYGCRQMSGPAFEAAIAKRGIRTVINLRGANPGSDWYDAEVAACQRAGVAHVDFGWSKNSIPEPESLLKFVELMETGEKPFLAHCQGGTHRTGVAAAVYRLLKGETPAMARKEFGPMFRGATIGQLVDLYEVSNMPFKQWVKEIYPSSYEMWKKAHEAAPKTDDAAALPLPAAA